VPFWIAEGKQKVSVYFTYQDNPVYTNPGAQAVWGKLMRDEKLIPYFVSMSSHMGEETALADIILPDCPYLERWEPESMPNSLWPWLGIRQPVHASLGESRENRILLRDIIHKLDPDGKRGMKQFWNFKDAEDYMKQHFDNIPGLQALETADLMVIFTRFRDLPDEQMKYIVDYVNSGKPIVGLRTATHAFNIVKHKDGPYAKYSFRDKEFDGGFGRQILGETWINHYGQHQIESTRGLIANGMENHPIVKGCEDIWGPSDVYGITTLTGDSQPVVMGQVLKGMNHDDPPNPDKELVPIAWIKSYTCEQGKTARVFTTTMGHGGDLQSEGFRRLLVNACFWALRMEDQIPERANVDLIGEYMPNPIGFGNHKKGLKPADHEL